MCSKGIAAAGELTDSMVSKQNQYCSIGNQKIFSSSIAAIEFHDSFSFT